MRERAGMAETGGKIWVPVSLAMIAASAAIGAGVFWSYGVAPRPEQASAPALATGSVLPAAQNSVASNASVKPAPTVTPPPELSAADRATVQTFLQNPRAISPAKIAAIHANAPTAIRAQVEGSLAATTLETLELKRLLIEQALLDVAANNAWAQAAALETARRLASPRLADLAGALLKSTAEPQVAVAALDYLGRIQHAAAFEDCLRCAQVDQSPLSRQAALRNLMLLGGRDRAVELLPTLESALADADVGVQVEALKALGRVPDQATPTIRARVAVIAELQVPAGQSDAAREAALLLTAEWAQEKFTPAAASSADHAAESLPSSPLIVPATASKDVAH